MDLRLALGVAGWWALAALSACGGSPFESSPDSSTGGRGSGAGGGGAAGGASSCSAASTCVPPAPKDWTGPVAAYGGSSPPSMCPSPWSEARLAHGGEPTSGSTCTPCECKQPTAPVCGPVTIDTYGNQSCTGVPHTLMQPNGCSGEIYPTAGAKVVEIPVTPGSCQTMGGDVVPGEVVWPSDVVLCGGAALEACSGGVCAPEPPAPFEPTLCVVRDGDHPCPMGYPTKRIVHDNASEKASCIKCDCAVAEGAACSGTVKAYGGSNCMTLSGNVTLDGLCSPLGQTYGMEVMVSPSNAGTCQPSGGDPSGTALAVNPITVCCGKP